MNDTLVARLQEVGLQALDFAEVTAKDLLAFVETQAPLLLEEWLTWNLWAHAIGTSLGVLALIISITFFVMGYRVYIKFQTYSDPDPSGWFITSAAIFIVGGAVAGINGYYTLQILIAPKVWILENIKDLM